MSAHNRDAKDGGSSPDADASVEPGVWRYEMADRATVIIDAEDYFRHMQQAMLKARRRVLMIGWDFDTRIHLEAGRRWWQKGLKRTYPARLGSFILWLTRHRPKLEIRILKWSYGIAKFVTRGSMSIDLLRWAPHRRIHFKFDTAHPVGASHHQKIVVLDDTLAVCGGIDMTTHRWDTREHKEVDTRRRRPRGMKYMPWHDATMMVTGDAATALCDLGHNRWERAGGEPLERVPEPEEDLWPEDLMVEFKNVEIGIARTRGAFDDTAQVTEIADLFERQIAQAKRFIYAETQYFASRRIANAICKRLSDDDPPEIVIVHPESADGWLEAQAMDNARTQLVEALGAADTKGRFHLYVPYTGETPIYVHAKIMIVDDRVLRIGSANFNNRSMGLDSECDMFIDADRLGNASAGRQIAALRHSLLAEHCGLELSDVPDLLARHGSMHQMIVKLTETWEQQEKPGRTLRRFDLKHTNAVQEVLAESGMLDPEASDEVFEAYSKGGLFPRDTLLSRAKRKFERRQK
ncbi:MAG: phospholipase D-like domain-containing protein [Parerythrobacter sp.]